MRVARWSGALAAWEGDLTALKARIGPVFDRRAVREMACAFIDGLLSGVERKTGPGWQSEQNESIGSGRLRRLTALLPSMPEIRTLLARLVFRPPTKPSAIPAWPSGDGDIRPKPLSLATALRSYAEL